MLGRENMSGHFWWGDGERFEIINEQIQQAPKQNSDVVGF
jgi:hypothetical protein